MMAHFSVALVDKLHKALNVAEKIVGKKETFNSYRQTQPIILLLCISVIFLGLAH